MNLIRDGVKVVNLCQTPQRIYGLEAYATLLKTLINETVIVKNKRRC